MSCFSLYWVENLVILAIVIAVIVAVLNLIVPRLAIPPALAWVPSVLNILLWGAALIFLVVVVFDLLSCALGSGPLLHRPLR